MPPNAGYGQLYNYNGQWIPYEQLPPTEQQYIELGFERLPSRPTEAFAGQLQQQQANRIADLEQHVIQGQQLGEDTSLTQGVIGGLQSKSQSLGQIYPGLSAPTPEAASFSGFQKAQGILAQQPGNIAGEEGPRPWYMNFDAAVLMETLKRNPGLVSTIPPEVIQGFPNQFFIDNPQFQNLLSAERIQGTGQWQGTGFAGHLQPQMLAAIPAAQPKAPALGAPTAPISAPTITDPNAAPVWWESGPEPLGYRKPNIDELRGKLQSQGNALAPAIEGAFAGGLPTYRNVGGMPALSPQYRNLMSPAEREVWDVTVNRTGGRAEDAAAHSRRLGSFARGAPSPSYSSPRGPSLRR